MLFGNIFDDYKNVNIDLLDFIENNADNLIIKKGILARYYRESNTITLPPRYFVETLAHELGHYIDDVLEENPIKYKSNFMMSKPKVENLKNLFEAFKKEYKHLKRRSPETMFLQDLINVVSYGKYTYKYGNRNTRELTDDMVIKAEIFANIFAVVLLGDEQQKEFIKVNLQQQWKEFKTILVDGGIQLKDKI